MTTLLLIRHAAADPVGRSISGRTAGVHLNADGRAQAERLAERLAGLPVARVASGPLERSRETAATIADRLGLEVHVSDALDEIDFGEWTGQPLETLSENQEWRRFNAFRGGTRAPAGELMVEVQARAVAEIDRLRGIHPAESVVLVSHGDVIRAVLAHYAGIPLDLLRRIAVEPGSISILEVDDWDARIRRLNDTGPLPGSTPG